VGRGKAPPHSRTKNASQAKKKKAAFWKRPLTWVAGVAGALVVGAATAFGTGLGQQLFGIVAGSNTPAAPKAQVAKSGNPILIEDVRASQWDYASLIDPRRLALSDARALALTSDQRKWPADMVMANQQWITLTVAGNSPAPVTINNIAIVKHCQAPLTGGTLFFLPPNAGSFSTSPVYFNLDAPISIGQYLSKQTGMTYYNFFARQVVTLRYQEPWTFAVYVTTGHHYCTYTFQLSVATVHGPVTEAISNGGKPFALTSDGETMQSAAHVPFASFAIVYASVDQQGNLQYTRVDPATYHG
jgi:hypothetical protein